MGLMAAGAVDIAGIVAAILGAGGFLTGAASLWRAHAEGKVERAEANADDRRVGIEQIRTALTAQDAVIVRLTTRNETLSRLVEECVRDRETLHAELDELRDRLANLERKEGTR